MNTSLMLAVGACTALALVWLGYPLAMRLWAALAGRAIQPNYESGRQRQVTVVLATRERADAIAARVANILDSEHPAERLRVIVALDAMGAKATPAELASLPACVSVVVGDEPGGKACALNAALRAAHGDVVVMADTAQRFDRCTIPELVAHLEDSRFAAVSGALELGGGSRWSPINAYWRLEKWLRHNEAVVHSSIGVTGAVYAIRRQCWPVLPAGTLLDDVYVPMALVLEGWRVGFAYEARAYDTRAFDASAESQRKTRTLTGVLQLQQLLPAILSGRNPVRAQYLMHKLARLTTPAWGLLGLLGALGVVLHLGQRFPRAVGGALAAACLLVLLVPQLRRIAISGTSWAFGMQVAVLQALRNGVQKRWRVW